MMRFKAGLFFALLLFTSLSRAQIVGEVESIGFSNNYRPACWTPMVVRLRAQIE